MSEELALRCEQATGPDHELDIDIGVELGLWRRDRHRSRSVIDNENRSIFGVTKFTGSVDEARRTIPEGWALETSYWPVPEEHRGDGPRKLAHARLLQCSATWMGRKLVWGHGSGDNKVEADGETLALAICAAGMRARAVA